MRRNNFRYNSWKKIRDERIHQHELDRKYKNASFRAVKKNIGKNKEIKSTVPENFSLIDNFENVTKYFNNLRIMLSKDKVHNSLDFKMESITNITADALMYLLTFIKNGSQFSHLSGMRGHLPKDEKCRMFVKTSGFLKYLSTNVETTSSEENTFIRVGQNTSAVHIAELCNFVNEKFGTPRLFTNLLYNTIGEVMDNATKHAYSDKNFPLWQKWLMYSHFKNNIIRITILDSGQGIIHSMHRKLIEKVAIPSDKELLISALKGEGRSATKQKYRNKGLPRILSNAMSKYFYKMVLITNKVCYNVEDGVVSINNYENSIKGTLYYFEIKKENENEN